MFNNTTHYDWQWLSTSQGVALVFFNSLLGLVGVAGNLLVIIAIAITPKLRTKTNYFLLSMAVTDFLLSVVCIPIWNVFILFITGHHVYLSLAFFFLLFTLEPLFCTTLIITLVEISAVRLFAVLQPFRFDQMPKTRFIVAAFAIPWGLSILLTAIEYAVIFLVRRFFIGLVIGFYILFYIIPLIVIIGFYAVIIWKSMAAARSGLQSAVENHRAVVMLVIVVLCFIITWSPYFVVIMTAVHCDNCEIHEIVLFGLVRLCVFLNAAMNPLIYTYRSQDFRDAFRRILSKIVPCIATPQHVVIQDKDMEDMTVYLDDKL